MQLLNQFSRSPAVEDALQALSLDRRLTLDMLFAYMLNDPFSQLIDYSLEEITINGERFDQLRGRFPGAFVTLLFHPNDHMHISDLLPIPAEIDKHRYFLQTSPN